MSGLEYKLGKDVQILYKIAHGGERIGSVKLNFYSRFSFKGR
jgi:hypothetical protein